MGLRVKELCKEKNITLAEIARRININPVTLSQSLNGNPTLSRLREVASILGVEVSELFDGEKLELHGCLYINGKPFLVKTKKDLEDILLNL